MSAFAFKENSSICLIGSTGSGKTRWVYRLMRHLPEMFEGAQIDKILYCYGVYQSLFDEIKQTVLNIEFQEGIPSRQDIEILAEGQNHCLLVLDDLMSQVVASETMQELFCQFCHHKYQCGLFNTESVPRWKMCPHYSSKHKCTCLDEKHAKRFSNSLLGNTNLPRKYQVHVGCLQGCYEAALWLLGA